MTPETLSTAKSSDLCNNKEVLSYLKLNPNLQVIAMNDGRIFACKEQNHRQLSVLINLINDNCDKAMIVEIDQIDYEAFNKRERKTGEQQLTEAQSSNASVKTIIDRAIEAQASDLYIDIFKQQNKTSISHKVFSYRRLTSSYDAEQGLQIVRAMWSLAKNSNFEENTACDCSFSFMHKEKEYRIRANSVPDVRGPSVVLRIRDPSLIMPLESLGYSPSQWQIIQRLTRLPGGLVLISGETNSGKSTTLASLMKSFPSTKKIIELADPVEILMDQITHIEFNHQHEQADIQQKKIQAAIVRQNPDILILGEIRDEQTAKAAMSMAIQGKLVYSTLHTQSCLSAIPRLENLGVDKYLLGLREFLGGVINQNLVPLVCTKCAQDSHESSVVTERFQNIFGPSIRFINPKGCTECSYGIKGQTLVAEVYPFALDRSGRAHKLISSRDFVELEKHMKQTWSIQSKHKHAEEKIQQGLIDPLETENIIGEFSEDLLNPITQEAPYV